MAISAEHKDQLIAIGGVLTQRRSKEATLDSYYEGRSPLPKAVTDARVTQAYRRLVGVSEAPWASLVVDSVTDRLAVTGIKTGDKAMDDALWGDIWQANNLDAESKLAHNAVLVSGRAFALSWPNPDTGEVEIQLDN